jgi:hypothetical protein
MATMKCPTCGAGTNRLIWPPTLRGDEPRIVCPECYHAKPDKKPYTGRKFWTGEETYGRKKLMSDEFRADLEKDLAPSAFGDNRRRKGIRYLDRR